MLGRALRATFSPRRTSPRRMFFGGLYVLLNMLSVVVVSLLRFVDRILFPALLREEVKAPVFVIANPRSGTTHLHRLLSLDDERFSTLELWQTILPSVTGYRLVEGVRAIDRRIGRPLGRVFDFIEKQAFGGWDDIHPMGFRHPEEDEAYFANAMITSAQLMFYPHPDLIAPLDILDEMPEKTRKRVMKYYRRCVQRHMRAEGRGRTFLNKSVFSSGRVRSLMAEFEDVHVVNIIRHPYEAIPSFCSMFAAPWKVIAPDIPMNSDTARYWAVIAVKFYRHMMTVGDELGDKRFVLLRYEELLEKPVEAVEQIYSTFGWELTGAYRAQLVEATERARGYRSKHQYSLEQFGLTREWIQAELPEFFERYGFER
jgi:hypothetical protein